jgi:hypothetical protein
MAQHGQTRYSLVSGSRLVAVEGAKGLLLLLQLRLGRLLLRGELWLLLLLVILVVDRLPSRTVERD